MRFSMKEEIIQTSLKQFLKHGIREMSIQKLIEPLGISTKTVYKYFKNKEELLEEALNLYHAQRYRNLDHLSAEGDVIPLFFDIWYTSVEVTYKINKAFFTDLHYYYPELGSKIEASSRIQYHKRFIHIIQRGMDKGVFEKDINVEVILESILVLFTSIIRDDKYKTFHLSPYNIFLNTIAVYIRGFCTARGIEELNDYIRTYKTLGKDVQAKKKMAATLPQQ